MTATTGGKAKRPIPPLYRNPAFFTANGAPRKTECTAASTGFTPGGRGRVQVGDPATGSLIVSGAADAKGGFSFPAAGVSPWRGSLRARGVPGEFYGTYGDPAGYTYTYATLRNATGIFGPASGLGSFNIKHMQGKKTNASINVKQGAAKFGGVMRMLGALTSKVCYYRNGGCSIASNNWRYDAIGISAPTSNGVVTNGYVVTSRPYYYCPATISGCGSSLLVEGSRFPWTTGAVTVTAVGRGPHKTVHYAHGYDNRTPTSGYGTIQMVSPLLTRWLGDVAFETGGIGVLRIRFVPEPQGWMMLVAGIALLCAGKRLRGRRADH